MGKDNPKNFPYLVEYLDKQVGEILAKLKDLGLSENTLVMFAGDNGTAPNVTTVMRDGREVKGGKGSPADTGAWVPLLANWPGTVTAGGVYEGMVDFTDILPTCLELAGLKPHAGVDGISFAPVLAGKSASPREAVFVLGGDRWYVRDAKWKLTGTGQLFDVGNSPYAETPVKTEGNTPESKAARTRLQAVLDKVHPEKHIPAKLKGRQPKAKAESNDGAE
ncbi:MAG: sulfatase-like hydrolase/transferase [Verrucomicrobia bacterium]|nr:sulfatase-like hydrolase/transferase [Verrucomicrobiota bacterium]